jgi:hypothetical protein
VYLDKPGDYHLEFVYRPRYWRLTGTLFWIATGSIIVMASVSFIRTRVQRNNGPNV